MTQLIINGIYLPETSRNRYACYPVLLSDSITMISGRMVQEVRGKVQKIHYEYDYMGNDLCRQLLSVLRAGKPVTVVYLPDEGDEMQSGEFVVESLTNPTFAFSKRGVPYWHDIAFTLREVKPHA